MKITKFLCFSLLYLTASFYAAHTSAFDRIERIEVNGVPISISIAAGALGISWDSISQVGNTFDDDEDSVQAIAEKRCDAVSAVKPNGCGTTPPSLAGDGCSSFGVGGVYNSIFSGACGAHDECYTTVNASRAACDDAFRLDMDTECSQITHPGDRELCFSASIQYADAVAMVPSSMFFEPAQNDVRCVIWHKIMAKVC